MIKYVFGFCFLITSLWAQDLKSRLLDYDFQRVKITTSAKSMIIDFVKKDDFDSINILIRFCDSINAPDETWLDGWDRLILKILAKDETYLMNPKSYVNDINLLDTIPGRHEVYRHNYPLRMRDDPDYYPRSPAYQGEDLGQFLLLSLKKNFDKVKRELAAHADLVDFLDIVFTVRKSYYYGHDAEFQRKVHKFLVFHTDSPFYNIVLYQYSDYRSENRTGGMAGITASYDAYADPTNRFLPDHPQLGLVLNIYKKRLLFHGLVKGWTVNTESALIYGSDTLKKGSKLNTPKVRLGLGFMAYRRDTWCVSPYGGYEWFFPEKVKSDKGRGKSFGVPNSHGSVVGIQIERLNQESFGTLWMFNIGYAFLKTNRIRSDLGKNYIFLDVGWALGGWERERYFPNRGELYRMR